MFYLETASPEQHSLIRVGCILKKYSTMEEGYLEKT